MKTITAENDLLFILCFIEIVSYTLIMNITDIVQLFGLFILY